MSKSEEILKNRLERFFRAQARYILKDNTINDNQRMEQMMLIEDLVRYMRGRNICELAIHEYATDRILAEQIIEEIESENIEDDKCNEKGRD